MKKGKAIQKGAQWIAVTVFVLAGCAHTHSNFDGYWEIHNRSKTIPVELVMIDGSKAFVYRVHHGPYNSQVGKGIRFDQMLYDAAYWEGTFDNETKTLVAAGVTMQVEQVTGGHRDWMRITFPDGKSLHYGRVYRGPSGANSLSSNPLERTP